LAYFVKRVCWKEKLWSVVPHPGRKRYWAASSSSFGSIISRHLFQALRIHFTSKAKERDAPVVSQSLLSSFLCMGMTIPVCQSLVAIPELYAA